jgi:hypothetical protein
MVVHIGEVIAEIFMFRKYFVKFIAVVMVMMVTAVSVHAFCHDTEAKEPAYSSVCQGNSVHAYPAGDHSHSAPGDDHSVPEHCDSCCACPCHTLLIGNPFQFVCSHQVIKLNFHDPFKALPEVYLPKFVPPHILA